MPRMNTVAREVCAAAESDVIVDPDGTTEISEFLHANFAPKAANSVYPEVVRFSQHRRVAQTMGEHLARSDPFASKNGIQDANGRDFPGSLRAGDASLSLSE